jgi:ketosteroid isomerase-like protein
MLDEQQELKEIMKAERRLVVSVQRKDLDALNQIWADEYLGTAPNGRVVSKADLMAAVKGGAIELENIEFDDMKLRLFGNIGVVTGRAEVKARVSGEDFSGAYRGTGIFVKREDGWHPVGVHVSPAVWSPGQK